MSFKMKPSQEKYDKLLRTGKLKAAELAKLRDILHPREKTRSTTLRKGHNGGGKRTRRGRRRSRRSTRKH